MGAAAVTLCFLLREGETGTEVLLGLKQTGFGRGKIVGIGGHVEPGETHAQAVIREVHEETGVVLQAADLADAGAVHFVFPARPEWDMETTLQRRRPAGGAHVAGRGPLAAGGAGRRPGQRGGHHAHRQRVGRLVP